MMRSAQTAFLAAALSALAAGAAMAQTPAPAAPAAKGAPAKPAAPAAANPAAAADPVVATVNGQPIRASELALAEEDIGPGLPPQVQPDQRRDYVLSFLTDMTLLAQAAQAQKLDQSPAFQQRLAYARTKALMEALMMAEAEKAVTEEAKRKTYEEFVAANKPETEVRARHILVDDEAKAKEIAAKAKAGADFATLAKENSKDSAEDGGDLGYFTKEQMVPEFADAAFKLDKGQVSDPVKSQFGWHIIKVEDKREKPVPTYDQVADQIDQYLVRKAQTDLVTKLRADAKVEKTAAAPAAAPAAPAAAAPAAPATPAAPAAPATPAPAKN
ncbi:peptidylprolyl isomerase [Aquabacter spiritensis]|uniref:Parvulin-like PPIase n=1 Tax=Aquabacter spiritensis TaxID=933073 RepID=A0A4R3M4B4_9HYPH|nr:peptidylprolyl isomerase [Aquabacter spiritensis]TCT06025.1 peptidyl-prolyl cis-trans isomerase C [Aquabacter spiritensis]